MLRVVRDHGFSTNRSARALSGGRTGLIGVTIPIIPGIGSETGETSGDLHVVLVFTTIALLLLHVAAAISQQFFEHDRTAGRMPPFQAPGGEQAIIGQG